MGIFNRISDIISANLNDMVERYEDPEQMLRQAVREMDEAIAGAKPDVARSMANEKTLSKALAGNVADCATWEQRAHQAVDAGDDALARRALARKHDYDKIVIALREELAAATEVSVTLRHQLEAMQAKAAEARRRLGTLVARKNAAELRHKMANVQNQLETGRDPFAKFERLSRKVEQAEAEAEAMAELARSEPSGGPSDDRELLGADEVEAELAELKRRRAAKE